MIIKKIFIGTALVLALGTSTIAFAKTNNNEVPQDFKGNNIIRTYSENSMYRMMGQYGYGDIAEDIEDGDYEAMDEYMNNLSDEDYQKMIDIMQENGYGNMVSMMESIGKDEMISMHNAMGGVAGCH